jgi:peptide/nickel transport system permease protein
MLRRVALRLGMMAGVLVGVMLLTFLITRLLPGSPVDALLGPKPTPAQIAAARHALALDRPVWEQFARYAWRALHGDLGKSLASGQPVVAEMARRAGATFELVTASLILALVVGVPLGVRSAVAQDHAFDHATRAFTLAGMAAPSFLVGMMLQMLFYGSAGLLPLQGRLSDDVLLDHPYAQVTGLALVDSLIAGDLPAFGSAFIHLILPTATLGFATLAVITRNTRALMIEAMAADHIRTLRAYGLRALRIQYVYALRATLIPLLTVAGLSYGYMLGGSIVVETVFDWPGLGAYAVDALVGNDYPAVMGVTLLLAFVYLTINLAVDLGYYAIDPRLRRR